MIVGVPAEVEAGDNRVALSPAGEQFLSWLTDERGRAANTLAAYRRDLRGYEAWLAQRRVALAQVSEVDVLDYVAHLWASDRAPASVARALVAVRSLHRFLVGGGHSGLDPTGDVGGPRVPPGVPKALSEDEVSGLLGAVVGDDATARRDRAMLELLYGTGMRISELVGLSLGDLALGRDVARVSGHGGRERLVPLGCCASDALVRWLCPGGRDAMAPARWRRPGDSEAAFLNARGGRLSRQGAWGIVHLHGDRVGLGERLTPHVLRHSCAAHMLDRGADIRVVQQLLGHAPVATAHSCAELSAERLRSAYQAAHPRARSGAPRVGQSGQPANQTSTG